MLISRIYSKDQSITPPPLMFFWENSHRRSFLKKTIVLKNFAIFTGKLQVWNFIKNDSNTGVFLWILLIFLRKPVFKTSANRCFWFFKTATEHRWASVLTLLLSSDNLFTGYEKLTLIWVGFLGFHFEVGGGVKLLPCLKLVRFMLETWNLVRKYTHICSVRKYTC